MEQKASRKKENTKDIKPFAERISDEYRLFYCSMMEKDKKEIFESCDKIKFYICVSEYFRENEDISKEAVKKLEHTKHPLEELWMYYLEHEYIYRHWDGKTLICYWHVIPARYLQKKGVLIYDKQNTRVYDFPNGLYQPAYSQPFEEIPTPLLYLTQQAGGAGTCVTDNCPGYPFIRCITAGSYIKNRRNRTYMAVG